MSNLDSNLPKLSRRDKGGGGVRDGGGVRGGSGLLKQSRIAMSLGVGLGSLPLPGLKFVTPFTNGCNFGLSGTGGPFLRGEMGDLRWLCWPRCGTTSADGVAEFL